MRSLLAVAETGTITAAAERLGLTQPALSRRIQQLEEDLSTTLLTRGRKGATLTASGALAEQEARVLVARYEGLRTRIGDLQGLDTGTVRLGGGATAIEFLVPPAIAAFQRQHPGIRFQVKEAGSHEIEQDVVNGALELGLVTQPVFHASDLSAEPLFNDRIVLVAHASHPLASREFVAVGELAGRTLVGFEGGSAIRKIVDDALWRADVQMNVVMELRSIPAIVRMVATTGSLAFVSRLGAELQPDIREVPVSDLTVERGLALVSRRSTELSAAALAFAKELLKRN